MDRYSWVTFQCICASVVLPTPFPTWRSGALFVGLLEDLCDLEKPRIMAHPPICSFQAWEVAFNFAEGG